MKTMMVAVLLVVAQLGGAAEVVQLDADQQARAGIEVRAVVEEEFGDLMQVVGQVVRSPGSTLTLKTVIGGRVEALGAAPGERVVQGQVLVLLHSHEILAMQGALLRSSEQLKLAEKRVEAGRELFAIDGISRLDLELREQEAFVAQLDYSTAREELLDHGLPQADLDRALATRTPEAHLPVTSPADGVVLELLVQEHEWVQEYAPLVVLGDPERVELELQLAPNQAASVAAGDTVEFAPVGRSGVSGRATVITRVPQVDPESRTVRIRARIDSEHISCFPGAFVQGTLGHGTTRRSTTVPVSAVINLGGRDVVFVRVGTDQFAARAVMIGNHINDRYEVVEGLNVDEEVVVSGVFLLKSTLVKGSEGEQ